MKKTLIGILIVIILLILSTIFYYNYYPIRDNEDELDENILAYVNRRAPSYEKISNVIIRDTIEIKNYKTILFTFDNNLVGEVTLKKGLFGRFMFESAGWGSSNRYRYRVRQYGNNKYFTVMGINFDMEIEYIKTELGNKEYILDVPQQNYFISYCKVGETEEIFPQIFKLFDSKNEDITDKIYSKYIRN